MLFKPNHVKMIQNGTKTQTRRAWKKKMVAWGGTYQVKTQMMKKGYHCLILVNNIRKERLGDISEEDAMKEGGYTVEEYINIFDKINKKNGGWNPDLEVYVIDFEVIGQPSNWTAEEYLNGFVSEEDRIAVQELLGSENLISS